MSVCVCVSKLQAPKQSLFNLIIANRINEAAKARDNKKDGKTPKYKYNRTKSRKRKISKWWITHSKNQARSKMLMATMFGYYQFLRLCFLLTLFHLLLLTHFVCFTHSLSRILSLFRYPPTRDWLNSVHSGAPSYFSSTIFSFFFNFDVNIRMKLRIRKVISCK